MTHRCRDCAKRRMLSLKSRTVMQGSPLGYPTWAFAIYLVTTSLKGVSSMKLHRDLGINQKSAWYLAHRIRETWKREESPFIGPTEADKTHVGGKFKNMHADKRDHYNYGKTIVAGVKDGRTNRVSAGVVDNTTAQTLQAFIEDRVVNNARVYADDGAGYRNMPFFEHESVNHSAGEYVRGDAGTQGIESFWSMLKRAQTGTFHKISPKLLDRYVTEFAGRHNDCASDTLAQMGNYVREMVGRRLKFADLIR
ncbi:MAG: IS1595 family transposase [Chloroflexi bacterium]|nr:IS1595 family transposase [Chloroflexota bacterium]